MYTDFNSKRIGSNYLMDFINELMKETKHECNKNNCNSNSNCNCSENKTNKTKEEKNESSYSGLIMNNILDNDSNHIGVELKYCVPGLTKDKIDISIINNICKVSSAEKVTYFGTLDSKVKIKFEIDESKTKAKLENGLLTIYIYKLINNPKKITISID